MKRTYTRTTKFKDLTKATFKLYIYDECLILLDKSNDIPEKIYDEILKRARYLWRARE